MKKILLLFSTIFITSFAHAVTIDNGITGDGFWSVDVLDAGDTRNGTLDPAGAQGQTDVVFDLFTYVDIGADGGANRLSDFTDSSATLSGSNQVTSSGTFNGPNGAINWTAVSSIAPGSPIYNAVLSFNSTAPFGTIRLINYFDEDVLGVSDDVLVVIGTPGTSDFQLLTIDDDQNTGVSHIASYVAATGMSYVGWAADEFSDLRNDITGSGTSYSIAGNVDTISLPPYNDTRFPTNSAYGPQDITNAFAFDFDPTATSGTVTFSLASSPDGNIPDPVVQNIPAVGPLGLLAMLSGLLWFGRRRVNKAKLTLEGSE